jgi:hypothetical protein
VALSSDDNDDFTLLERLPDGGAVSQIEAIQITINGAIASWFYTNPINHADIDDDSLAVGNVILLNSTDATTTWRTVAIQYIELAAVQE